MYNIWDFSRHCAFTYHVESTTMIILLQKLIFPFLVALIDDNFRVFFREFAPLLFRHRSQLLGVQFVLFSSVEQVYMTAMRESIVKFPKLLLNQTDITESIRIFVVRPT